VIRILIIDDASFVRLSIRTLLVNNGFEVVGEAADGMEGIERYKNLKPDIVFMDISMPKMTGLEALKNIRNIDPKAVIIMLSAMGQEKIIREAVSYGAKYFIVKPYKEDYVIKTLRKIIETNNIAKGR
jgi:two-component system chemotaxis response regulator CheY